MKEHYLSVSALTKYLKRKFECDPYLSEVYLTGEISNFRLRSNGHQYFSLKDDKAVLSAIMFRSAFSNLAFTPKVGQKVFVTGRVSLYEASGQYQIYIDKMEPDGIGALYQAFKDLQDKLKKEGLFDQEKKEIPSFPKSIGVITSPSGAVIRDILTTIKRRYPLVKVVLYPALVQGNQAADDLVKKLKQADHNHHDTLIVGRGGGSIEDLWPFNEEKVARAIFETKTPIISSVGHETDTTIADFVADVRAATPTAAAELAVPVLMEELQKIKEKEWRIVQRMQRILKQKQEQVIHITTSPYLTQPKRIYEGLNQRVDVLQEMLFSHFQHLLTQKALEVEQNHKQLLQKNPLYQVREKKQKLSFLQEQLFSNIKGVYDLKRHQTYQFVSQLNALSPLNVLDRGFSYTTTLQGTIIKNIDEVNEKDSLLVHLSKGTLHVHVQKKEEEKKRLWNKHHHLSKI